MISIESTGSFENTERFLRNASRTDIFRSLDKYGQEGVNALRAATPKDSAETANSWVYEILRDSKSYSIIWSNTHVESGRPIAILLQYGHATGTGGYVAGYDYINPALKPIFDRISSDVWKAVTS